MQEGLRQQKRQTWFDFLVTLAGKQEWANVLEYFYEQAYVRNHLGSWISQCQRLSVLLTI